MARPDFGELESLHALRQAKAAEYAAMNERHSTETQAFHDAYIDLLISRGLKENQAQRELLALIREAIPTSPTTTCPGLTMMKRTICESFPPRRSDSGQPGGRCAWQESNLRPRAPEARALSPELQARSF